MAKIASKDVSWDDAITTVLNAAGGALHYSDIAERISSKGLRQNVGANPAASVATALSKSIRGEESPFQRTGDGNYILKDSLILQTPPISVEPEADPVESETGALRAFGMFWLREQVAWIGKPNLLGRQQLGALDVNFCDQVGVYLLHDRERVIYVGRASDTMYARLKSHTSDRLGGRWDRFSWFGLRSVGVDGSLSAPAVPWTYNIVIETLEALLIESLEPPLNRKRGDNFSGVEYIQVPDPAIKLLRRKQLITELARQAGVSIS